LISNSYTKAKPVDMVPLQKYILFISTGRKQPHTNMYIEAKTERWSTGLDICRTIACKVMESLWCVLIIEDDAYSKWQ